MMRMKSLGVPAPVLFFALVLLIGFAYPPGHMLRTAFAQGTSPTGSYGFLIGTYGDLALGVMNFDGAGNVIVAFTEAKHQPVEIQTGTITGTYSMNPNGTGKINLPGGAPTLAMIITDGGSGLLLADITPGENGSGMSGTARRQ